MIYIDLYTKLRNPAVGLQQTGDPAFWPPDTSKMPNYRVRRSRRTPLFLGVEVVIWPPKSHEFICLAFSEVKVTGEHKHHVVSLWAVLFLTEPLWWSFVSHCRHADSQTGIILGADEQLMNTVIFVHWPSAASWPFARRQRENFIRLGSRSTIHFLN